jgi:GTP pyrophosphokinase
VEVQIRSERMDEIAERGFAAHWKYKGVRALAKNADVFENWLNQVRETLENNDSGSAVEFLTDFQSNLFAEEVHVFTPKGHMRILPDGATALDFAFSIHSDLGSSCQAVRVNNRLVPFHYRLVNGDQVQVLTSKNQKPTEDWLQYVITSKARNRIRAALKEEKRRQAELGKEILERKFKQFNFRMSSDNISFLERFFSVGSATELYFRIAKGKIDLSRLRELEHNHGIIQLPKKDIVIKKNKNNENGDNIPGIDTKQDTILIGDDFKGFDYQMAKCCNPIPGDKVFGFISIGEGIKIHRFNCPNAVHLMGKMAYRCIKARWKSDHLVERIAAIRIIGIDQLGLVNKLTEIISKQNNVNMKSISFDTNDGVFEGKIKVMVYDTEQLEQLTRKFEEVDGVQRVTRWDTEEESPF